MPYKSKSKSKSNPHPKGDMPADLLVVVGEGDRALGEGLASSIPVPEKPYNPKVVTSLADALSAASKLMGEEAEFEAYTEAVDEIGPDMARILTMVSEAAADYGEPLPVALEEITGDKDLTAITAHIMGLSKDRDFRDWLKEEVTEEPEEDEVTEEAPIDEEPDEDFDFASRMRF